MVKIVNSINRRAPSVDEARLAAAMSAVFRKSNVMHGALLFEKADGHYMHEVKNADVPSHVHSLAIHLTEKNRHPGLVLGKTRHTPIAISDKDPQFETYGDVRDIANALKKEGFLSLYYLPIRDLSGRLFVSGIGRINRNIKTIELRLIHSYCLDAIENVVTESEPASIDKSILTPRERESLILAAKGFTEKQAAKMLSISPFTVRVHIQNCKHKLGARSKVGAVLKGLSLNEIMPADTEFE